jgi:hypothetical protein
VVWRGEQHKFQQLLERVHSRYRSAGKRTISYRNNTLLTCLDSRQRHGFLELHLANYNPDFPASILPKELSAPTVDSGETPPPKGSDYIQGDIMAIIKDNDVLYCCSGLHSSAVRGYAAGIFNKAEMPSINTRYTLEKVAAKDKVEMIREEGVKRIELRSSLYQAEFAMADRRTKSETLLQSFKNGLKQVFNDEYRNIEMARQLENVSVDLQISYNPNKKEADLLEIPFSAMAEQIADEDDLGYTIVTKSNSNIRPDELSLNKKEYISRHGNSIDKFDAWDTLETWYRELADKAMI